MDLIAAVGVNRQLGLGGRARGGQDKGRLVRLHPFARVALARALRDEAEACIGEELVFNGRASIDVSAPDIPDDPTRTDPFALASFDIERPTYATPFL